MRKKGKFKILKVFDGESERCNGLKRATRGIERAMYPAWADSEKLAAGKKRKNGRIR